MKVKVCGMKYPDNIRSIARLRPDIMGFIFYRGSPRYIETDISAQLKTIRGIKKAGVFVDASIEYILEIRSLYDLNYIQLHGNETVDYCRHLRRYGHPIIKAFPVSAGFDFERCEEYAEICDLFLFDTASQNHGGSGRHFNWALLDNYKSEKSFLLSGGLSLNDVEVLRNLDHPSLIGYDINSKFESRAGLKKIKNVKKFIDELQS